MREEEWERERQRSPSHFCLPSWALFFIKERGKNLFVLNCDVFGSMSDAEACVGSSFKKKKKNSKKKPKRYLKILVTKLSFRLLRWIPWLRVLCFQGTDLYKNYRCVHFPLIDFVKTRMARSGLISHYSLLRLPPSTSSPTYKNNTEHLTMTSFERVIINCTFYSVGVLPLSVCVCPSVSPERRYPQISPLSWWMLEWNMVEGGEMVDWF